MHLLTRGIIRSSIRTLVDTLISALIDSLIARFDDSFVRFAIRGQTDWSPTDWGIDLSIACLAGCNAHRFVNSPIR